MPAAAGDKGGGDKRGRDKRGCLGERQSDGTASTDLDTLLNLEVDNTETAMALHQKLTEAENAVLTENKELWEKVFLAADKGSAMIEDGSNYGDFLLKTIEDAKGQFSEEELKTLRAGAEKIQKIEGKLTIWSRSIRRAARSRMVAIPLFRRKTVSLSPRAPSAASGV